MGSAPSHKKAPVIIPKWAKQQDRFQRSTKYPYCRGTFPDCPEEIKSDFVADVCKVCPLFKK
ncbi:hypothetical protein HYW19_04150 [Candidatus Woesearchaeota archaeon]|nr:hypothetical protein [Candidatus Woesearchaeota archaeon]